jgi:hypothetical protein
MRISAARRPTPTFRCRRYLKPNLTVPFHPAARHPRPLRSQSPRPLDGGSAAGACLTWTAAACCRFREASLLAVGSVSAATPSPNERRERHHIGDLAWTGSLRRQQGCLEKAAAGCRSPKALAQQKDDLASPHRVFVFSLQSPDAGCDLMFWSPYSAMGGYPPDEELSTALFPPIKVLAK